jgi:hypothetical protein
MKLYTEEQVREVIMSIDTSIYISDSYIDSKIEQLTPIELPSAEEASERLYPIKNTGSMFMPNLDEVNNTYKQEGFIEGTKWVINHIKQQDNGKI